MTPFNTLHYEYLVSVFSFTTAFFFLFCPLFVFILFRVPAFLAQEPPVLLHPERVVPLSQSEQFERGFQPNVALAPPTKTSSDGMTYSKVSDFFSL